MGLKGSMQRVLYIYAEHGGDRGAGGQGNKGGRASQEGMGCRMGCGPAQSLGNTNSYQGRVLKYLCNFKCSQIQVLWELIGSRVTVLGTRGLLTFPIQHP